MEPESDSTDGELRDRYRLIALVGTGGMGRVWRARDELLDREVAVKEVRGPDALPDLDRAELLRNTVREARAAARLDHPNVIRVFDVVRSAGRSWIVMEYVPSRSLHEVVALDGPLSHQHAARVGLAVLDALDAAHRAGVLHLDVKPHNVLIADDGRVVLTDFGLATIVAAPVGPAEPVLGSPHYVAPERYRYGISSRQADLWSLGATLYTAVEGRPPFSRADVATSLSALLTDAPDPPQHPGPLHAVIAGLLTPDPAQRMTLADARTAMRDLTRRAVGVHAVPTQRRSPENAVRYRSAAAPVIAPPVETEPERVPVTAPARWRGLLIAGLASAVVVTLAGSAAVRAYGGSSAHPIATASASTPLGACADAQPLVDTGVDAPVSLPQGWLWHVDTGGFALPVPQGWSRGAMGGGVCFGDPGGVRSFSVERGGALNGEPVRHWQDVERDQTPPGYQKVSMGPLLITGGGADWEYSWQPPSGPRLHTYRMLLAAGDDRSYALTWTTRDTDWDLDLPIQRLLVSGFRDSARPMVTWTIPGPGK